MSSSLRPHRLQHARLPCPSPSPRACSDSYPSSRWRHPAISSSVIPFSSCLQSFPASGSFPVSQFFSSGGQSIGASASASVLPMNIQGWFPLGLTGLISLQSKGLLRAFSSTTVQKHHSKFSQRMHHLQDGHWRCWGMGAWGKYGPLRVKLTLECRGTFSWRARAEGWAEVTVGQSMIEFKVTYRKVRLEGRLVEAASWKRSERVSLWNRQPSQLVCIPEPQPLLVGWMQPSRQWGLRMVNLCHWTWSQEVKCASSHLGRRLEADREVWQRVSECGLSMFSQPRRHYDGVWPEVDTVPPKWPASEEGGRFQNEAVCTQQYKKEIALALNGDTHTHKSTGVSDT